MNLVEKILALEAENAALKKRWEKALSEAREAAGHEFGLWPLGAAAITHQLREENAALREEVKEQDKREATWAKRFDQQAGSYAVRLYNSRKRRILIARRRILALREENAALREDKATLDWIDEHLITEDWPEVFVYMEDGMICQIGSRADRDDPDYIYGRSIREVIAAARKVGASGALIAPTATARFASGRKGRNRDDTPPLVD